MKKLILILSLAFALPILNTGCPTPPNERVATVTTLKAVGQTAEGAVMLSAQLYRDGKINATQARKVNALYDEKFQPAYRAAVAAAKSDLSSIASPDLVNLAAQLAALVSQFQNTPTK